MRPHGDPHCDPRGGTGRIGWRVRVSLRRRLFFWFGAAILFSALAVMVMMSLVGGGAPGWRRDLERVRTFTSQRFERVWDDPKERDILARQVSNEFHTDVVLKDRHRRVIASYGTSGVCERPAFQTPVLRDGQTIGHVVVCGERERGRALLRFSLALVTGLAVLWAVSGRIAWRLARPLGELARVAQELGSGRPSRRVELRRKDPEEIAVLSTVLNEMATRIEKQMADQRELLAAVSHEIRTPLARIRLLVELAREKAEPDPKTFEEIDKEVMEIDALVSELLASSRLDFAALTPVDLDAQDIARRALERAGVDESKLAVSEGATKFRADPTLLSRALANLLVNAKRHGGGVERLEVKAVGNDRLQFAVEDAGPGIGDGDEERIFETFFQRPGAAVEEKGALGLGLALVKRIAEAHGGVVFAGNRPSGGARIGFEIPRT